MNLVCLVALALKESLSLAVEHLEGDMRAYGIAVSFSPAVCCQFSILLASDILYKEILHGFMVLRYCSLHSPL